MGHGQLSFPSIFNYQSQIKISHSTEQEIGIPIRRPGTLFTELITLLIHALMTPGGEKLAKVGVNL